jgi:hypothetical protein
MLYTQSPLSSENDKCAEITLLHEKQPTPFTWLRCTLAFTGSSGLDKHHVSWILWQIIMPMVIYLNWRAFLTSSPSAATTFSNKSLPRDDEPKLEDSVQSLTATSAEAGCEFVSHRQLWTILDRNRWRRLKSKRRAASTWIWCRDGSKRCDCCACFVSSSLWHSRELLQLRVPLVSFHLRKKRSRILGLWIWRA